MRHTVSFCRFSVALLSLRLRKEKQWNMVIHTCNPNTRERRQEDCCECEASMGYRVLPCLKNKTQNSKQQVTMEFIGFMNAGRKVDTESQLAEGCTRSVQPVDCPWLRTAVHKVINLLKTWWGFMGLVFVVQLLSINSADDNVISQHPKANHTWKALPGKVTIPRVMKCIRPKWMERSYSLYPTPCHLLSHTFSLLLTLILFKHLSISNIYPSYILESISNQSSQSRLVQS